MAYPFSMVPLLVHCTHCRLIFNLFTMCPIMWQVVTQCTSCIHLYWVPNGINVVLKISQWSHVKYMHNGIQYIHAGSIVNQTNITHLDKWCCQFTSNHHMSTMCPGDTLVNVPDVMDFRLFERIFIEFLKTLIYMNLKLQISIYIHT